MITLNLVEGDITPTIILTPEGAGDLAGKTLKFEMNRVGRKDPITLDAVLSGDEVLINLTQEATATPGSYFGQLVVVGEQTSYERVPINIRPRFL